MNSVGGEADPLQCRVRVAVLELELARLANQCGPKRASAGARESTPERTGSAAKKIAGCTGRTCAKGSFGVDCGMGCLLQPNVKVQWLRSNPLQCRVRGMGVEPARLAQPESEKRASASMR